MRLFVREAYDNTATGEHYEAGTVIDVTNEKGRWLLRDAPGCFGEEQGQSAGKRESREGGVASADQSQRARPQRRKGGKPAPSPVEG